MENNTILSFYKLTLVKEYAHKYTFDRDMSSPQRVYEFCKEVLHLDCEPNEKLVVLLVDTKNKLVAAQAVSSGSINCSMANARLVYQTALLHNAAAVILVHNHPSGDAEPSREDISATRKIAEAGGIMEIPLLDHLVIGDSYVSLGERGYI